MENAWGASPKAWDHFANTLGWLTNLLPVASNPNLKISEMSSLKGLGKTPSLVNFKGEASGFAKWTANTTTGRDVKRWSKERDHGICVQTGKGVIAIDIDVPDPAKSAAIRDMWLDAFPHMPWAERYREGTGKTLLVIDYPWGELYKRAVPVDGGVVELLGTGQQFIAESSYIHSGSGRPEGRYLWRVGPRKGWPGAVDLPCLDPEELEDTWALMCACFATGEEMRARSRRGPMEGAELPNPENDPVAHWITENWNVYDYDSDGRLFIECPFAEEHTSDSGPTATAYFPAGTGGYQRGHFDCKHAHCNAREDADYLDRIGFNADQFPDLGGYGGAGDDFPVLEDGDEQRGGGAALRAGARGQMGLAGQAAQGMPGGAADNTGSGSLADAKPWPQLVRDGNGKIEAMQCNVVAVLGSAAMTGVRIAYDDFTAGVVTAPAAQNPPQWEPFRDVLYSDLRMEMEARGFKEFSHDRLRQSVHYVAAANVIDTATEWLTRLEWDGVPRVDTMVADTLPGVGDTPYSRALSRYIWTVLAGRVLEPGVKADMVPVLVGGEGLRKSSWAKALAPHEDAFTDTVSLKHRDNDNSRKMRGRLVIELAELKGLASRDGEEIRAFLAQQWEEWTPKYVETNTKFARRCLMVGTTNDGTFIEARMGMRRLLPYEVEGVCDVDYVIANREQLWAEAAVMFRAGGVDWSVERLAQPEREKHMDADSWTQATAAWLLSVDPFTGKPNHERALTASDALGGAIGMLPAHHDKAKQTRMGHVLAALGFVKGKGSLKGYELRSLAKLEAWRDESEGSAW